MKTHTTSVSLWQAFALLSVLVLLSACGDGKTHLGPAEETIEITDSDATQTINRSRPYELLISGDRNTITIASDNQVTQLTISGNNNIVILSSATTVDSLTFSGSDNTITKLPGSVVTSVSDQGSGNSVING